VFLHCDRSTDEDTFAAMTDGLAGNVTVLPRQDTAWATWGIVAAELAGYRTALERTNATHVALLSGSDYPLASTEAIQAFLQERLGQSVAWSSPFPDLRWGRSGGFARVRYRHRALGRRMIRIPGTETTAR
jgi:hypothetical protein